MDTNEIRTDPDVVEQAEKLAEQFRSSLYENDDLDEWITNYVYDNLPAEARAELPNSEPEIGEAEMQVLGVIQELLKPMIEKFLAEPQFFYPAPPEPLHLSKNVPLD